MDSSIVLSLLVATAVGAAAGYIGSFMVLRHMALVGDALSHVALPGLALAIVFQINPFIGAFIFLFIAVVGIWLLEEKTSISTEALVGVFFTFSLAIGILITPEPELLEALFGDISHVTPMDAVLAVGLSVAVVGSAFFLRKAVVLGLISRDLADATGIKSARTNLFLLLLIAVVVALGVKVVGTFLMGSLVIIPAVSAQLIATRFRTFSLVSAALGMLSAIIGISIASIYDFPPGPLVVLSATTFLLVCLAVRRK